MIVSAIVAYGENFVIGNDNQIPWHLPKDLKYFKRTTLDHHIIMGRKSFESIGRPLPKRTNIVVTRDVMYIASGCIIAHSIEEALDIARENGEKEAFLIGGAEIYHQGLAICDKLYITLVHISCVGDAFFSEPDWKEWEEISSEPHKADDQNPYDYVFKVFKRKKDS